MDSKSHMRDFLEQVLALGIEDYEGIAQTILRENPKIETEDIITKTIIKILTPVIDSHKDAEKRLGELLSKDTLELTESEIQEFTDYTEAHGHLCDSLTHMVNTILEETKYADSYELMGGAEVPKNSPIQKSIDYINTVDALVESLQGHIDNNELSEFELALVEIDKNLGAFKAIRPIMHAKIRKLLPGTIQHPDFVKLAEVYNESVPYEVISEFLPKLRKHKAQWQAYKRSHPAR